MPIRSGRRSRVATREADGMRILCRPAHHREPKRILRDVAPAHPVSFGSPGTLIKMPRRASAPKVLLCAISRTISEAMSGCAKSVDRLFRLNHATRLKQFVAASDPGRLQVRRRRASLRKSAAFPKLLVVQVQKSSTKSAGRKDSFLATTFSRE